MSPRQPRAGAVLGLVLLVATLAGCGSSSSSNGVAGKNPTDIVAAAEDVAEVATAVHVSGSIVSGGAPVTFDLDLVAGRGGRGQLSEKGLGFELIELGHNVFIKGSSAFYSHIGGAAAAQLLQGKWLKAPATSAEFASLASLTNLRALVEKTLANHGTLSKGPVTEVNGQKAVGLTDASKGGVLYVATSGPPYPIEISQTGSSGGKITFGRWNKPVTLQAPGDAIDIAQLQAGH